MAVDEQRDDGGGEGEGGGGEGGWFWHTTSVRLPSSLNAGYVVLM